MNNITIYKNYYTCGRRKLFALTTDMAAITSEAIKVKLPEKCKAVTDITNCTCIEMPSGDIADKIITSYWNDGSIHAYVLDCGDLVANHETGELEPRRYYFETVNE